MPRFFNGPVGKRVKTSQQSRDTLDIDIICSSREIQRLKAELKRKDDDHKSKDEIIKKLKVDLEEQTHKLKVKSCEDHKSKDEVHGLIVKKLKLDLHLKGQEVLRLKKKSYEDDKSKDEMIKKLTIIEQKSIEDEELKLNREKEIDQKDKEIKRLKTEYAKSEKAKQSLTKQVQILFSEKQSLIQTRQVMDKQVKILLERKVSLTQTLKDKEELIKSLKLSISKKEKGKESSVQSLKEKEEQIKELKLFIAETEKEQESYKLDFRTNIEMLAQNLKEKEAKIKELKLFIAETEKEKESYKINFRKNVEILAQKLKDKELSISKIEKEKESFEKEISSLKLKNYKEEIEKLKLQNLQGKNETLEANLKHDKLIICIMEDKLRQLAKREVVVIEDSDTVYSDHANDLVVKQLQVSVEEKINSEKRSLERRSSLAGQLLKRIKIEKEDAIARAETSEKARECTICFEIPSARVRLSPCGHELCDPCSRNFKKCPICERKISSRGQIYK